MGVMISQIVEDKAWRWSKRGLAGSMKDKDQKRSKRCKDVVRMGVMISQIVEDRVWRWSNH
jgi:hypothetical protein